MPEEFTASTESAAPTDSGVDAVATAASSAGVGESAPPSPAGGAIAPAAAEESIDVGWSLDDAFGAEPPPTEPEAETDIEEMLKEPGLDPARAPGLVEALRSARKQVKETHSEAARLRAENSTLRQQVEPYGGPEGVEQSMRMLGRLVSEPQEGALDFMNGLAQSAVPTYWAIADLLAETVPEYLVDKLRQAGQIADAPASTPAGSLNSETLNAIPEHLREVAKRLAVESPAVMEDLLMQVDEVRNHHLERELRFAQLDRAQQEQARAQWEQQAQQAQAEGQRAIQGLSDQYEQAHYRELSKWTPYGEDQAANQRLHGEIVEGAFAEILRDRKFAQVYQDAHELMRNAPRLRLQGQGYRADDDLRKARGLAAQFNARLGQLLRARVTERAAVYSDALKWRDLQRQQTPQRTEIPGANVAAASSNGAVKQRLTADGRLSDAYLEEIAASVVGR